MHSAARTVRSGSPTDTQTVSRTPHSRGISVLFRSRTTSYQPPFTPESIDNSTRPDGSDTFNCSALAGTLLMCASHCVNVSISSFRWILGLICNRDLFSKNKSGFATCYHVKLLLIFRKYRKRYFLHNEKRAIFPSAGIPAQCRSPVRTGSFVILSPPRREFCIPPPGRRLCGLRYRISVGCDRSHEFVSHFAVYFVVCKEDHAL